jgi:autotransporter-associated beta strand protein
MFIKLLGSLPMFRSSKPRGPDAVAIPPRDSPPVRPFLIWTAVAVATTFCWVARGDDLIWEGKNGNANDGNWTTAATVKNWKINKPFVNGDNVTFDDTAAGTTTITVVNTGVMPGAMVVNNSTKDYSFTGGPIAGATSITKNGSANLTLSQANTYTGGTTLKAGTLTIGNDAALGTGTLTLGDGTLSAAGAARTLKNATTLGGNTTFTGQQLTFTSPASLTGNRTLTVDNTTEFKAAISDPANMTFGITKAGAGTLTFSAANLYKGDTTVSAGILNVTTNNALGSNAAGVAQGKTVVSSGATLQFEAIGGANVMYLAKEPLVIQGSGVGGIGAVFSKAGNNSFDGNITLANASTIGVATGTFTLNGSISGDQTLTKIGPAGNLVLTSANTFDITKVDSGTLTAAADKSLGKLGVIVTSGAELDFSNVQYKDRSTFGASIAGNGVGNKGAIYNVAGNNLYNGPIKLAADAKVGAAAGTTLKLGDNKLMVAVDKNGFNFTKVAPGKVDVVGMVVGQKDVIVQEGTLVLEAANTYHGPTVVNGGLLLVNNTSGSGTGNGDVTVHATGALAGTGSIGDAVTVEAGGTVHPGDGGPGILSVLGGAHLNAGSFFSDDLNGTSAGTGYGQLSVTGGVSLSGSVLAATLNYAPTSADKLFIIENLNPPTDAALGQFVQGDSVTLLDTGNGQFYKFQIGYTADFLADSIAGGHDVVLYNSQSVPEPSTCVLLLIGVVALCGRRALVGACTKAGESHSLVGGSAAHPLVSSHAPGRRTKRKGAVGCLASFCVVVGLALVQAQSVRGGPILLTTEWLDKNGSTTEAGETAGGIAVSGRWTPEQRGGFDLLCHQGNASVALGRGDWKAAQTALDGWLKLEPANALARQRLGKALFHLGQRDAACRELERAAKDDASLEPAAVTMGWLYTKAGDQKKAEEWLDYAVKSSPASPAARIGLTTWLLEQGRAEEAQAHADAGARLDPQSQGARRLLALAARARKDFASSELILQALVRESPGNAWARNQLALVLVEQADPAKQRTALELAELSVRQEPNSPDSASSR